LEQGEQESRKEPVDIPGLTIGKKTRRRLPSEEKLRNELVYQLRESLRSTNEKMNSQELTLTERQRWTQVHSYTVQVYNTVLKDLQLREWERRLKEVEKGSQNRHA